MPYTAKGKCVYRKDTGKKVGCTKGSVKKYLAALHANVKDVNESEEWYDEVLNEKPLLRFDDLKVGDVVSNLNPKFNNLILGVQDSIYFHIDSFKEATTHRNGYAEKETVAVCSLMRENPDTGNYYGISRETIDLVRGNNKPVWTLIYREGVMESINESEWFEDVVNEPIMLKVEELEMGDIIIPTPCFKGFVKDGEYIVIAKGTSVKLLDAPTHWVTLKRNTKVNTGGVFIEHDTETGKNCRFKLVRRENIIEESEEFDWVENPAQYIKVGQRFSVRTSAEPLTVQIVRIVEKQDFNRNTIYFSPINLVGTKYPGVPMNVQRLLTHINSGSWTPIKKINESEDDFEWAKDIVSTPPLEFNDKEIMIDIQDLDEEELKKLYEIVSPYISKSDWFTTNEGEEVIWKDNDKCFKKMSTNGSGKFKTISLHCGIEDNDYLPLKGALCCLKTTYQEEIIQPYMSEMDNTAFINGRDLIGYPINESEWFEDVVNEPIMLKVEELEMGDIVIPTCLGAVYAREFIVISKGTSVKLLHEPTHWVTLKRNTKENKGNIFFQHDTEIGKACRFELIHRENDIIEESEEFEWAEDILSTSPLTFGGKEIMIDVSDLDDNEKIRLLDILEPHIDRDLDGSNSDGDWGWNCLIKNKKTKSLSLHCGIEDNGFEPQKGRVCCLSYLFGDEKEQNPESIVPVRGKDLLGLDRNQQTNMNESEEEEFNWAEDIIANTTEEIDISNDFDLWKNKLVEGSVVKITGRWEDMYFEDDVATIVNSPDEAGSHLLKFDRIIYEFGNEDEGYHTHCGENYIQNIKCECQRKRNNRDEVGKCWWTNLSFMEKIIYLPFEGKQITESEEDEFNWAEDLLDFNNPINITDKLDVMEELPVGSILQVKGYQDEMELDMEEVKLIDKAEDKDFDSTYYLFKLKYERGTDSSERSHCGTGLKNRKICECRDTNEDDDYHQSEIGKCWWIELKKQDKVIYYPNRIDLSENKIKKPLLTEGRYDAITRKVVRDIMKLVTTSSFGDHDLPYDINNEEYEYQQENLGFSVELQIVKTEKVEDFFIDAATSDNDDDETVMLVKVFLNPTFDKQNLEKLFYKLQEVIRHEIEHFTQHGPYRIEDRPIYKGDTANLKTVYGHHKNVIEVPALVHGFYRRAKLEKRPLDEIMMEDLDSEIEKGFLTKNQAQKLLTIWVNYAKKNLPAAVYKEN